MGGFTVQCFIRSVPRDYHVIHLEGVTHFVWKYTPCKRAVKLSD